MNFFFNIQVSLFIQFLIGKYPKNSCLDKCNHPELHCVGHEIK